MFDRQSNRIILNDNGKLLQQSLCSVFRELDNATEQLSSHAQDSREIRLLVRGMRRKITDLITKYSEKNSSVSFKTVFNYGEVDFKEYDIIIDEENERYAEYERIELFNMNLKLKCASNAPLCKQTLSLNELCDQPFILMDANSNMNRVLKKACRRAGLLLKFLYYVTILNSMKILSLLEWVLESVDKMMILSMMFQQYKI